MATQTHNWRDLAQQAADLQQKAQAMRDEEKRNVVAQMRAAVTDYGIEPHELFPGINKAVKGPVRVNGSKADRRKSPQRNYPESERAQIIASFRQMVDKGTSRETAASNVGVTTITLRKWFKDSKIAWPAAKGKPGRKPAKKVPAKKPLQKVVKKAKKVA